MARLTYRRLHWGKEGERPAEHLPVAHWSPGDRMTEIGEMRQIVYRTQKGLDGEDVDYDHAFARPYPRLLRHDASGRLIIAGGRYRVEARGIVDNAEKADDAAAAPDDGSRVVLLGDLIEVGIVGRGTLRPKGRPRPRLCYHGQTGLLVIAGGISRSI